jgi:hypothetical protein
MTTASASSQAFEQAIREATRPLNGQLPRPWMTDLSDPLSAEVFIVGRNPARSYEAGALAHARHLDALFNRNGESCRGLYQELVSAPSLTRNNIDLLRDLLREAGVTRVLETNVICYSSPMSADLADPKHIGGRRAGEDIFRLLLGAARPRVLIAHGSGTIKDLARILDAQLPKASARAARPATVDVGGMRLICLPSLAPPAWNRWQAWAIPHLKEAASMAATSI